VFVIAQAQSTPNRQSYNRLIKPHLKTVNTQNGNHAPQSILEVIHVSLQKVLITLSVSSAALETVDTAMLLFDALLLVLSIL